MSSIGLPDGLTTRPATTDDGGAIADLYAAADALDYGQAETSRSDIETGLNFPGLDLEEQTLLVFDGKSLVAYADVHFWKAEVAIHPDWRRRGIGNAVILWTEETTLRRMPEEEEARIGQTIIDTNTDASGLFRARGYTPRHTSWALRLPKDVDIAPRPLPEGYEIRIADLSREQQPIYQVIEDAFNEWPNRKPNSYENWQAWTVDRPDFDPELLFVAVNGGEVVGASVGLVYPEEGWVHQIAVEKSHRHQGLAKALLARSFEVMRQRGCPEVGLSTDSRTGALDLYLDLGMVVRQSFTHYSKLLRPGKVSEA